MGYVITYSYTKQYNNIIKLFLNVNENEKNHNLFYPEFILDTTFLNFTNHLFNYLGIQVNINIELIII